MTANNIIKVILKRAYEYKLSDLYSSINDGDRIQLELSKEALFKRAREEAFDDFISEVDYFADNIEDFVGATVTIEGTGLEHNISYNLITWPESQNYMEEEWFEDEAILALGNEDVTGSGAYFIPTNRINIANDCY